MWRGFFKVDDASVLLNGNLQEPMVILPPGHKGESCNSETCLASVNFANRSKSLFLPGSSVLLNSSATTHNV